jgi:hypothetical protein
VLVNGGASELRAHLDYELERLEEADDNATDAADDTEYNDDSSLYTNRRLLVSSLSLLNALKKVTDYILKKMHLQAEMQCYLTFNFALD